MKIYVNGTEYQATAVQTRAKDTAWNDRSSKAITLEMTYADAMALFVDDIEWSVESVHTDENGNEVTSTNNYSDYALAGPVTDNRDGTITVKMGRYLKDEIMMIPLNEVPASHKAAQTWRNAIEVAMQSIEDDQLALAAAPLYPKWADMVVEGMAVEVGTRFRYGKDLYKALTAHTLSEIWVPGVDTASLYVRIDEVHAGTADDPIPYNGNMELTNGLYYIQNNVMYLCNRDSGAPVYNALAELIGIYVEVVNA